MEQPSSSIFIVLGFLIIGGFSPLLAQSENRFNDTAPLNDHHPPSPSPSPPPSPPPPPPLYPPPPSHPPPPPPFHLPPPPPPHSPPPPPKPKHDPKKNTTAKSPHSNHNLAPNHQQDLHQSIDKKKTDRKINFGKKIGLLFAGIAGILQVAVVGFLVIKEYYIRNSLVMDEGVNSEKADCITGFVLKLLLLLLLCCEPVSEVWKKWRRRRSSNSISHLCGSLPPPRRMSP